MRADLLTLLLLSACTAGHPEDTSDWGGWTEGFAIFTGVSMDYSVGSLSAASLSDRALYQNLTATSGDPVVRVDDGRVLQLNRFGYDTVRIYAPGTFSRPALEFAVGDDEDRSTNPQDARVCGGELFLTLYGRPYLPWYHPDTGQLRGQVDLRAFSDGDGVGPEASTLAERDGTLFVGLNRLDREDGWSDRGGYVVEIDCASGAQGRAWPLGGNTSVWEGGPTGVLASARPYQGLPGGLFAVDEEPEPLWSPPEGEEITGVAADTRLALVTTLSSADLNTARVWCVDLNTGSGAVAAETQQLLSEVRMSPTGEAWLTVGWGLDGAAPELRIYSLSSCALVDRVTTTLAPFSVDFF
ncbi:MAG: hypothetical protein JXX28_03425 [Deltaproteobacteria bacterium]|nr:hypothetical protein [Deltaproteobacteria bacterium]